MSNLYEGFELVKSISIENLLRQRDSMVERLHQARLALCEADEIGKASGIFQLDGYSRNLDRAIYGQNSRYAYRTELTSAENIEAAARRIDAMAWDHLMLESGLWSLMDAKAREEWRDKIDKIEVPPLTRENIAATFEALHGCRGEMFERGVLRCFKALAWCYKTNLPQKFGKRIHKRVRTYGSIDSQCTDALEDLQRVFRILDGKPEEDRRSGLYTRLYGAYQAAREARGRFIDAVRCEHDDTYMSFRIFQNGNAAITFKRPDLVNQLNKIIAKHYPDALPAPK